MNFENSRSFAKMMDHNDPLKSYRKKFYYPKNGNNKNIIYFCGNSLGLQPKSVRKYIEKEIYVWEKDGVLGPVSYTHLRAHET